MLEPTLDRTAKGLGRLADGINKGLGELELILYWIDKGLNTLYS
jgi:hypothetical protein